MINCAIKKRGNTIKKIITYGMLVTGAFFVAHGKAACPTLTQSNMAYYLCPITGAYNGLPQSNEFGGMIYTRPANWNPGRILANVCSSAGMILGQLKDGPETFEGVESAVTPGRLVCRYNLTEEQRARLKLEAGVFRIVADFKTPKVLEATKCPEINMKEISDLSFGSTLALSGTSWKSADNTMARAAMSKISNFGAEWSRDYEAVISCRVTQGSPQVLTEPYVRLSPHTALRVRSLTPFQW